MNNYPLVKAVIPFIIGILCGLYFHFEHLGIFFLLCVFLLVFLFPFTFRQHISSFSQNTKMYSGLLFFILFLLGYSSVMVRDIRFNPTHYGQYISSENFVEFKVDDMPVEGTNSIKIVASIAKVKDSNLQWHQTSGKAIIYLQKDSVALALNYGDHLLAQVLLKEIETPTNPYQFNYKQYLSDKSIFYQGYLHTNEWQVLAKDNGIGLFSTAYKVRKHLLHSLKESGLNPVESAIASALLLGWDKEIDASTYHAFTSAGITHLLCVSGLHVGIIASIISSLLFFLGKTRSTKIVRSILELLFIWMFAFITGLAPSVQRAAIMFSFIIIGRNFSGKNQSINSLAISALIILLINPFLIRNVGFQLSYVAVLGIISMQPLLKDALHFRFKITRKIWEYAAVAIVAQIATAPFVLYYFNQFPVYFLITNVVIVPFAAILLQSTLAVSLFWWIPFLGNIFTIFLSLQVSGMVYFVSSIEKLPMALITSIHFDFGQAVLLAIAVVLLTLAFSYRNTRYLVGGVLLIFVIFSYELYYNVHSYQQKSWIVYDLGNRTTGIEFISGNKAWFVGDFAGNEKSINDYQFKIGNNHVKKQIKNIEVIDINDTSCIQSCNFYKHMNFIQFDNQKILLFNKNIAKDRSQFVPQLDYIVLMSNPYVNIKDLHKNYNFKELVFCGNNSNYQIEKWTKECDSLQIPYFSVAGKGAFIKE